MIVDIPDLKALLDDRLPHVWAGETVQQAALPWPPALDIDCDSTPEVTCIN